MPQPLPHPPFDSLPLDPTGPPGNAWGLFGPNDSLGMLNLLNRQTTVQATKEITTGIRISTDLPLNHFSVPAFGRQKFKHEILHRAPRAVNDDVVTFNTQSGSQWDGFRHFGYQKEKVFFGGRTQEEFLRGDGVNGTGMWVEKGGIVGRGVLLDYQSWVEGRGIHVEGLALTTHAISLGELQAVAEAQGVSFQAGDILLVRSGYLKAFNSLGEEQAREQVSSPHPPAIGVESSEEILRWLWENQFAAVAGDQPSFEAWPCQDPKYFLHEWLLAGWGVPIGELFDLEKLAAECKTRRKWSFFFCSMPLNVPGGVASPPNGVATL